MVLDVSFHLVLCDSARFLVIQLPAWPQNSYSGTEKAASTRQKGVIEKEISFSSERATWTACTYRAWLCCRGLLTKPTNTIMFLMTYQFWTRTRIYQIKYNVILLLFLHPPSPDFKPFIEKSAALLNSFSFGRMVRSCYINVLHKEISCHYLNVVPKLFIY